MLKGATSVWSGKQVAFIGGDARQLEVITKVLELGAFVKVHGFQDSPEMIKKGLQTGLDFPIWDSLDILILPVTGIEAGGKVLSKFQSEPLLIPNEFWSRLPRGLLVFTGIAKPYLLELAEKFDWKVISLMDLDEVAILNSIPSAEGAIQLAMQNTTITIHGANCAVLGFGRCGSTLSRTLQGMGAFVSTFARKAPDLARIREMGLSGITLAELTEKLPEMDIIFNTVPALLLNRTILEKLQTNTVIIDIASSPGGVDFQTAEELGIKALLAPSLPGIVAPKTAGQILADTIVRLVDEMQ